MSNYERDHREVVVDSAGIPLEGDLTIPPGSTGLALFAHGSGSSRQSTRNRYVAEVLNRAGIGTLLFDLLTLEEEQIDLRTRHLRFDIGLLADRVIGAIDWTLRQEDIRKRRIGLFGASTGAAAALVAAAARPERIAAVVSRGGRPDLAGDALPAVRAPTLLIVGGLDTPVIGMNETAKRRLQCPTELQIIPRATHLFQEAGTLEQVAYLAARFFQEHLGRQAEFQPGVHG